MRTNKSCKNRWNINKILKNEYFFKNYDKIQQALRIVKPIKHKGLDDKNLKDKDDNDLDAKNKVVEQLDYLVDKYNEKEKKNMTKYKNMRASNNIFLSSYSLLRSKSTDNQIAKHQFDHLINTYAQNKYKLPSNVTQRNVFIPTPLAMTKFNDLNIYYRTRANKRNKSKHSKIKSAGYLENIADYLNYMKDNKENKRQIYSASYLNNYSNAVSRDEQKKTIRERKKCQNEISQSKKDIHEIKDTIITLEKKQGNNDLISMNMTKRSDFSSTRGKSRTSPYTTRVSFFDKKKTEGLLLTGNRKTTMPVSNLLDFSRKNSTIRARNSVSNYSLIKKAFTTSRTILDVSKLKVNEMYNITKGTSLFNNSSIAKDIAKYFQEKSKQINLEKKRLKSSQLVNLISSTKTLIQSIDIRNLINHSSSTKSSEAIKRSISFVDKIDQTINKIDYDMFKCALAEKDT